MIKIEIVLKTDDKEKVPTLLQEIAGKIKDGIVGKNSPNYFYRTSNVNDVMEIFGEEVMTREEELVEELRCSLPSKQMLDIVSFGAVEINGMLITLKSRYGYGYLFHPNSITRYYKPYFDTHNYEELQGKNVIFSTEVFSRRGLLALIELGELMDKKQGGM